MTHARSLALLLLLAVPAAAQVFQTLPLRTAADRESYRTIHAKLANDVLSVSWEDRDLRDALRDVARTTRINVVPGPLVREKLAETVSLTLNEVPARSVLTILAERFDLVYLHRRGYLLVTTPEDAVKRSLVLEIHGVAELLYVPPDFPAPRPVGIPVGNPSDLGFGGGAEEVEREEKDPELLLELIRTGTGGDAVWEMEGVSLTLHRTRLVVRHTPTVQRRVARFLSRLRGHF